MSVLILFLPHQDQQEHPGGLALSLPQDEQRRNGQKYDPELEHDLADWILSQTEGKSDRTEPGEAAFPSRLINGRVERRFGPLMHQNSHGRGSLQEPLFSSP